MSWFGKSKIEPVNKKQIKKLVLNHKDIEGRVNQILRQLRESNWTPDYIVGIVRGGLYPAVMLSHYLNVPMHALKVTLRDGLPDDCDTNCWMAEDAFGYQTDPRRILIVDDINDSGATFNWIKQDWPTACMPHSEEWNNVWHSNVRFATVVNNLASSVDVDYFGSEINKSEDDIWIEFPQENWWLK